MYGDLVLLHILIIVFFSIGIARRIAFAGYGVFALDYPGFGLSEGLHGYIPSFETLVGDAAEHFAKVKGMMVYVVDCVHIFSLSNTFWKQLCSTTICYCNLNALSFLPF